MPHVQGDIKVSLQNYNKNELKGKGWTSYLVFKSDSVPLVPLVPLIPLPRHFEPNHTQSLVLQVFLLNLTVSVTGNGRGEKGIRSNGQGKM